MSISAWDVVSTAPKVLAAVLSVLLLVFFFLIYGDSMLRRLVEITPSFAYKRHAVTIVRGIQTEVSRYLLTALLINASLGAITAGMLWLYKVPDPLLWGAVAMFANFIPYVGAIVTTTVLAVVSMLYAKDASLEVFLPALTFAGITAVEGNLITPMIQGAQHAPEPDRDPAVAAGLGLAVGHPRRAAGGADADLHQADLPSACAAGSGSR